MVKYDFQIYPFSGEMFTAVNARTGVQLDAVGALPEETSIYYGGENIYNTTDFIPLNDDCRVLRIVCPVSTTPHYPYVCFYSSNDAAAIVTKANFALPRRYYDEVAGQWVQIAYDPQSTVDQRVCFATAMAYMAVPSTAKYIRVSADGKQWSSLSIQTYGAYGNIGSRTSVHPIYKEDLSIIYEREGKGRFLRRKLSSAPSYAMTSTPSCRMALIPISACSFAKAPTAVPSPPIGRASLPVLIAA